MTEMRAKLRLLKVDRVAENQETLRFAAVGPKESYAADGFDENNTFAKFTPCADLTMQVLNPILLGKFEEGQEFYVDFTRAD